MALTPAVPPAPTFGVVPPEHPSLGETFKYWLKLGFISFGGPAGQIAMMHQELVERRRWISEHRYLHALNYCMLLPGPEAIQLAIYISWLMHGIKGALEYFGWLTGPQMMDGLALGETTPEPPIMIVTWVGYMGAVPPTPTFISTALRSSARSSAAHPSPPARRLPSRRWR